MPSFLQGHPSSLRFGHPDVTAGDTAFLRGRHAMPFLRSYRGPALAELGHPDVASGRDSYAFGFSRVLAWARYALPPLLQGTRPRRARAP